MGLIVGSGSFSRYLTTTTLPDNFIEKLQKMILPHVFKRLDEKSTDERSVGWVNIMDMFDNTFSHMDFLKEPYIAMSMRVDERKIPATALKQHCIEAEKKIMKEEKVEFLSKRRKAEIRDTIRTKLIKRAIPITRTYDMIWNYTTGVVLFGGISNKLCDEFAELFFRTFSLQLQVTCPYTMAARFLEKKETDPGVLEELIPFSFRENLPAHD